MLSCEEKQPIECEYDILKLKYILLVVFIGYNILIYINRLLRYPGVFAIIDEVIAVYLLGYRQKVPWMVFCGFLTDTTLMALPGKSEVRSYLLAS